MTGQYAILSEFYDRLMEDTDYGAWVSFYPRCFEKYGTAPGKILDLACGTGNVTLPLAKRGYELTGIDQSAECSLSQEKKRTTAGFVSVFPSRISPASTPAEASRPRSAPSTASII